MSLSEFQREFAARLLAPALESLPASVGINGEAGLQVHRNTTMSGLVDALLANYPTLVVLMGEDWVADAATRYARQYPPRLSVLAEYGAGFADFLRQQDVQQSWPYLPGVAELDWAWMHCFLAPDVPALQPHHLASLAPEALASLQLRLHPAAHLGVYAHSAASVWQANRPPATPPAELNINDEEEAALMLRNEGGITLLPLDAAGRAFLAAIVAGNNMGTAASLAIASAPDTDFAACWSGLLAQGAFVQTEDHGER